MRVEEWRRECVLFTPKVCASDGDGLDGVVDRHTCKNPVTKTHIT